MKYEAPRSEACPACITSLVALIASIFLDLPSPLVLLVHADFVGMQFIVAFPGEITILHPAPKVKGIHI